jgi:CrcB protein
MLLVTFVGVGGFFGAVFRHLLSNWVQQVAGNPLWPYGTLAVNATGSLLLGILVGLAEAKGLFSPEMRALLFVGVLGGFTTFSTFGVETSTLLRQGSIIGATANIVLQVLLGVGAAMAGYQLSRLA